MPVQLHTPCNPPGVRAPSTWQPAWGTQRLIHTCAHTPPPLHTLCAHTRVTCAILEVYNMCTVFSANSCSGWDSNPQLTVFKQVLYQLSYQGSSYDTPKHTCIHVNDMYNVYSSLVSSVSLFLPWIQPTTIVLQCLHCNVHVHVSHSTVVLCI